LAKSILRLSAKTEGLLTTNAPEKAGTVDVAFQKLTALLLTTNNPPALPRIPKPYIVSQSIRDQWQHIQDVASALSLASGNPATPMRQQRVPLSQANATYGTTPAASIWTMLDSLCLDASTTMFVDAGSGMGVPSLAAALYGCHHVRGLEVERGWHDQAMFLKQAYDNERRELVPCRLEFLCTDMVIPQTGQLRGNFVGADIIFMNSVTWDAPLCRSVSERVELDTVDNDGRDVFVISLSRKVALPSFDLVDILSLNANGGMFSFYVSQRRSKRESNGGKFRHTALSDSETMRELRETQNGLLVEELISLALSTKNTVGLGLLAVLGASEPTARLMSCHDDFWESMIRLISIDASLPTRASGSMILRAIVDHSIGKRSISQRCDVAHALVQAAGRDDEHPVVRANLLDVLGTVLYDSPLDHVSEDLDHILLKLKDEVNHEGNIHLLDAAEEIRVMRKWWKGEQRTIPKGTS